VKLIKTICPLLLFFYLPVVLPAQDKPEYAALLVPDSLKKNAYSVTREEVREMNVTAPGRASLKIKKVVTVFDAKGDDELAFYEYEDKFRSLDFAEVKVYDELGRFQKRYKKKEMEKIRGAGSNFIDDNKYYYIKVGTSTYPVTVEFVAEVDLTGILDFNDFTTRRPEEAIQKSVYTITTLPNNPVRYKNYNTGIKPVVVDNGKTIQYSWQLNNVTASIFEKGAARGGAGWPRVVITPTLFSMEDYPGDYSTWQNFGRWYGAMSNGAGELPEERKTLIRAMTNDAPKTEDKIKILYQYLQKNYRYVSIQLGIGGFKPFPASYVEKNKFGDCKALSNYMQTLLTTAGIKSYQALINAGPNAIPADPAFANNTFNHVILCVPQPKDTIWLECTSQDAPFGRLGAFTENRNALLITETGGVLTATPASKAGDNLFASFSDVELSGEGNAVVKTTLIHTGEIFDQFKAYLWEQDENEQKDYLINSQGVKQFDEFKMEKMNTGEVKSTRLQLRYEKLHDFAAGSKRFYRPYIYSVWSRPLPAAEHRQTDYFLPYPFIETDTVVFHLPAGFTVENLPKTAAHQCADASFTMQYQYDATTNTITTISRLEVRQHRIPPARYQEVKIFFDRVIKELEQRIIIKQV
jgi:hypothetical protein